MIYLRAGYTVESFYHSLVKEEGLTNLLVNASHFKVKGLSEHITQDIGLFKVVANMISRGAPTRMSISLERTFAQVFNLTEKVSDITGAISFEPSDKSPDLKLLKRAAYIIDPHFSVDQLKRDYEKTWEQLDSSYEEDFLFERLLQILGQPIANAAIQLIETQRPVQSAINPSYAQQLLKQDFSRQRLDFTLEYPQTIGEYKGTIIEVDGPHHEQEGQKILDQNRDRATHQNGWAPTLRLKVTEWQKLSQKLVPLKKALQHEVFKPYLQNLEDPLYLTSNGKQAIVALLAPIGIARLQQTLLQLWLTGQVSYLQKTLKIAVVERDIPCAALAVEDLYQLLEHLNACIESPIALPEVELTVFSDSQYAVPGISADHVRPVDEIAQCDEQFDVVCEISLLRRVFSPAQFPFPRQPHHYLQICSVHAHYEKTRLLTSEHLHFKDLTEKLENDHYKVIEEQLAPMKYLLQSLFRKRSFRPGQLPILNLALGAKPVIGLLPTGGGKSLTYQLAALLQPGHVLVVDPIKSLMHDQLEGLRQNLITNSTYLNSSVRGEDRLMANEDIQEGRSQFVFVSPERLQIPGFRSQLTALYQQQRFFSYAVIDEAHCVSEWGHDFRTAYLSLGENIRRYCLTADQTPIPVFALTATASFDVLADVQRELSPMDGSIIGDESLVQLHSTKRHELQFKVERVTIRNKIEELEAIKGRPVREIELTKLVGEAKHARLNQSLLNVPRQTAHFNENPQECLENEELASTDFDKMQLKKMRFDDSFLLDNQHAGIVFCPHRSWYFGVTDTFANPARKAGVLENLPEVFTHKGAFMGAEDDLADELNIKNQNLFKANELNLLVATKAFGMGIDKPNIRYTVHITHPQSIESFVQEAGRAGRDRKIAICHIIVSDEKLFTKTRREGEPYDDRERISLDHKQLLYFHNNSFRGQEREKRNIYELLTEVRYPEQKELNKLQDYLADEQGLALNLTLNVQDNGVAFLNAKLKDGAVLGGVRLTDFRLYYNHASLPEDKCLPVLRQITAALRLLIPEGIENIADWLESGITAATRPGIEPTLDALKIGKPFELTIGFNTDIAYFTKKLKQTVEYYQGGAIDLGDLKLHSASNVEDFLDQLYTKFPTLRAKAENDKQVEKLLRADYNRMRDKSDTEKAIYRLLLLGIINDYSVDFNAHTYQLYGRKCDDESYLKNLENYLLRYYSEKRTAELIKQVYQYKGDTLMHKCLNFLISFIYREIESKRYQAIGAMQAACTEGIEKGNVPFKEYIDLYFHSKYAREQYEVDGADASLLNHTDKGRRKDLQIVWNFIDLVNKDQGAQLNNLKHLRGACLRILNAATARAPLLLLKAYAGFIIEFNRQDLSEKQLEDTQQAFLQGMLDYRQDELADEEDFNQAIERYRALLLENCSEVQLGEFIDNTIALLRLKAQVAWLQNFNQHFLHDYTRANQY